MSISDQWFDYWQSTQKSIYDLAVYVGEPEVAALGAVGEPLVIKTQAV